MGRIRLAMLRIPNVLHTNTVANQRTLEQKISDQGPSEQRVNPHLLGLALNELSHHRGIVRETRPTNSHVSWYANAGTPATDIDTKLSQLVPLYEQVAHGDFPNHIGDALEIVVYRCLQARARADRRCTYLGSINYRGPKLRNGRYAKTDPPTQFLEGNAHGPADFIYTHPDIGGLFIECKNVREWIYPNDNKIKELLRKCCVTGAIPVFIARRIHYSTISNLFEPAGIISHESYFQYYPDGHDELLERVRHKRSLGFTDARSWKDPHPRTATFFKTNLPEIGPDMADRFRRYRRHLREYAEGGMSRADLYRAIHSPGASRATRDSLPDDV